MKYYVDNRGRMDPSFLTVKCENCVGPKEKIEHFSEYDADEMIELFTMDVSVFSGPQKHIVDPLSCVCVRKKGLLDFIPDLVKGF